MTSEPGTLTLTPAEQTELAALAAEAVDRFGSPAAPVLRRLTVLADVLPRRVREFLAEFRHDDPRGGVVVRGLPVDAPRLPPTPGHWRDRKDGGSAHADFLLALLACRLGDLFAWRTLQEGRLLTDVLPVAGEEDVRPATAARRRWSSTARTRSTSCDATTWGCCACGTRGGSPPPSPRSTRPC